MNGYDLSRTFWDFSFENPDKVRPNHIALYFFSIEHCNRLGWKKKFGLPTSMAMEAIGVKSYKTYIASFKDLVEWGFFDLVEKSKNQYSSNVIELVKFTKANTKALDKAMIKHGSKHVQSTDESIASINKPINNKTNKPINQNEKTSPFENTDSETAKNATKAVSEFFGLNELNHPTHYMKIGNFIRFLEQQKKMGYFRNQFKGYKSVKIKNPKYIHSWQKYIGDAEKSYEDGAWNEKDWVKESIKEKEGEMVKSSISLTERLKRTNQLLKEEAEFFAKNKAELIAKNK